MKFIIEVLGSHCVLGGEYGISIFLYFYLLPGILLQSLLYTILRIFCGTIGLDPIALAFNIVSGICCIVLCSVLLIAMIDHCRNNFRIRFFICGICGLVSGILHLVNACICNHYMPMSERNYLQPSKRARAAGVA